MAKRTSLMAAVAKAAAADQTDDTEEPMVPPVEDPTDDTDGVEDVTAKAVLAERKRILGIQETAFPGQEALVATLIDRGATLGDAAIALNADHKAKAARVLASLDDDEAKLKGLRSAHGPANPPAEDRVAALPEGEAKWKADYAGSKDLQAEFGSEGAYLAFNRAEAQGRVRILNKKGN